MKSRVSLALIALVTLAPTAAHAGGFELAAPGTRSLGRGGAFMSRADDPMALTYNPAALAFLPGYQLQLGSHLIFYDACVQRSGTYGDSNPGSGVESRFGFADAADPSSFVNREFPQVCRGGAPGPSPQLVFSARPIEELGFALGLNAPSGVGSSSWGDADGTVTAADGTVLPTPVRYGGIDASLLLFHISAGVGFSPIPELSFGATFQWGISTVNFNTFTNAGSGPQDPAQDINTQLDVADYFIPAAVFSVHAVPIPQLDIVGMARISDGIDADGTLNLTTGFYGTSEAGSYVPIGSTIDGVNLRTAQPFQFGLSVRYSDQRNPNRRPRAVTDRNRRDELRGERPPDDEGPWGQNSVVDSMLTEVWDIEVDVIYQFNDPVNDFVVTNPMGASVNICEPFPGETPAEAETRCNDTPSLQAPVPARIPLAKGWQDQLIVRVGGDFNLLPGLLAIRGGVHFETSGVNQNYQTQDFIPGMRLGLHLGATVRIERFDISLAYAHIFQFTETITDARYRHTAALGNEGQCTDPSGAMYDPDNPVVDRGCYPMGLGSVINAGTYSASFNMLSLSMRYHFN